MGRLIRSMDWSKSPLGPIESWPQSLRAVASLCVSSNFPMALIWGPERVQLYNDGYWPICGGKHPHSMGQDFAECWASPWPVIKEAFYRALAGEASYLENQRMFLDRNGYLEETFFTFSFSPVRDETGGVGGLFHPVTEQTGKMLSERRMRTLRDLATRLGQAKAIAEVFPLASDIMAGYDLDLPFVLFYQLDSNDNTASLVTQAGLPPDTALSPPHVCLSKIAAEMDSEAPASWPLAEVVRTGAAVQVDDLEKRFGSFACGPYPESPKTALMLPLSTAGSGHPSIVLIAGVSSRLPLDDVYRGFYDLLAATLAAAIANAQSYEEAQKRAEALAEIDRAKTAFFNNVSHEFRTPLTLMLGPLEDLLNDPSLPPEARHEQLSIAHRNALRLKKLVNTLLDFSRLEAGRVQASYQPTDLAVLTEELASMFRSAVEQAGLTLTVDCTPHRQSVYVDHDMWEKILLNLLSNAFKHTFEGEIEVTLRERDTDIVLQVRDTGVGIPETEVSHLFERFHRVAHAQSRTHEGTGIGLALVSELVKLHGGTIALESVVDQGSVFTIVIPTGCAHLPIGHIATQPVQSDLASTALDAQHFVEEAVRWLPSEMSIPATSAPLHPNPHDVWIRPDGKRVRILLADDNADMREYVSRLLNTHCDVEAVPNGEAALEAAYLQPPDLILSDIMMPRMDGFQLLSILRQDPTLKTTPVILLSARAGEEARVEGLQAGANDYLVKPFNAPELLARIQSNLNLELQQALYLLRESEERFRLLVSGVRDYAIFMLDPNGYITTWNEGAKRIKGYASQEIIGQHFSIFYPPEAIEKNIPDDELKLALKEGRFEDEGWRFRKDGSSLWANVIITPMWNSHGQLIGFSKVTRDLTQRKQLEEQLRSRTHRLETVNKELEAFSYSVSHDLRAPLRTIDGFSQALMEDCEDTLDADAKRYLHWIREGAQRMAQLIDGMLNLSRLTRGDLQKQPVDLSALVREITQDLQGQDSAQNPARTVQFIIQEDLTAQADKRLIQAVLQNLLGNAWKYTSHHPTARIEFGVTQQDDRQGGNQDNRTIYFIRDDGAGFDMRYAGKLFGLFQRLHDSDEFQGNGIGLATVQRIIHRHGGEIWAESEVEKGATFYFTLEGSITYGTE